MSKIVLSVVVYNSDKTKLLDLLNSFLLVESKFTLIIIDNSPTDVLQSLFNAYEVEYFHNPTNPGFGAAHNIAITKSINIGADYHFIINPDVYFESNVIDSMVHVMKSDSSIGMMMPQILNLNGTIQTLPKLLPTPIDLLLRKVKIPFINYSKFINKYELRNVPNDIVYNTPILSGCFTLLNLHAIKKIGLYDDNYFMYFEDWDLSRRMHKKYKTLYNPNFSVVHGYESGANKNFKLFKIYIKSAIHYFNKWGWFFDKERKKINTVTLTQFQ